MATCAYLLLVIDETLKTRLPGPGPSSRELDTSDVTGVSDWGAHRTRRSHHLPLKPECWLDTETLVT